MRVICKVSCNSCHMPSDPGQSSSNQRKRAYQDLSVIQLCQKVLQSDHRVLHGIRYKLPCHSDVVPNTLVHYTSTSGVYLELFSNVSHYLTGVETDDALNLLKFCFLYNN